jgi:pimeloyl-ACP methyl ester carboxylesterase
MVNKRLVKQLVILTLVALLSASCVTSQFTPSPVPPTSTPLPPTTTSVQPTDTPVPQIPTLTPPTSTLKPSSTGTKLFVSPGNITGMVDVGGRSLHIHCEGEGSPTIILESGQFGSPGMWKYKNFYMNLTKITRTCAYDRANLGTSDPAPKPRTAQDMVNDLHTMLVNAQISGPYVLVGHSIGGWIVRLYAAEFPDEVTGIVLLDSSHPDQLSRVSAIIPTESSSDSQDLIDFRNAWNKLYTVDPEDPEGWDILTSAEQVRAVTSLGDVPLIVLSHSIGWISSNQEINQSVEAAWHTMQLELAALSTNGMQYTIKDAGHYLWFNQPDAVVNYIRQAVELARSYTP